MPRWREIVVHQWRCDRCGALAWQPCRGLRTQADRRIAHVTRWTTAVAFTLATTWLGRLSVQDRLVLATRAVGGAERAPDGPTAWPDTTALLWQADLLQRALVHRVVDDAAAFVDVEELRRPGVDLAAAMKDAGNLLCQLHTQDDHERSGIGPMVLPELDGHPLSLTELREARDLGRVEVMTADMARRADVVADATTLDACRWAVQWEPTGVFRAEPIPRGDADQVAEAPCVRGWAAHPAAVADELGRRSTRPRPAEISWHGARPSSIPRLCEPTPATEPVIPTDHAVAAFWAGLDRLADVVATIDGLRRSCPPARIPQEVAERAAALQAAEPQLPDVVRDLTAGEPWASTTAAEWVRTRAVVRTADEVWGEFDDDEADVLPDLTRELLAAPYAEVPAFLARHFAACSEPDTVRLLRLPGPAGPLYAVGASGSHRAHMCRILGLPWMFAVTETVPLPRRMMTTAATADLWHGLLARSIIRGDLVTRPSGEVVELRLAHAPAPWMLLPAEQATTYNQRYELLHPGALGAAGVPDAALDSASAWRSWLTER